MKKKVLPFVIIISAFTVIVSVMIIEKNNKTPVERYLDTSQTVENSINEPSAELYVSITTDDSSIVSEVEDTRSERVSCTVLNTTHTVQYEFLLYEIIDDVDIASQMKYAGDYFYSGTLPDPDYLVEYTDYPAMRKDYPEVDEYISSNGEKGMTAAEYQAFLNQHLDEYTTSFHPKTKYLFLKCRISNVSNGSVIEYINDLRIIMMNEDNIIGIPTEFNCYFDHSQNTTGDERIHNYLQYKFEPGETIECVIGCAIREDPRFEMDLSKEYSYYIGFLPIGLDNLNQLNPSIDEGFVLLDSLQKEA